MKKMKKISSFLKKGKKRPERSDKRSKERNPRPATAVLMEPQKS